MLVGFDRGAVQHQRCLVHQIPLNQGCEDILLLSRHGTGCIHFALARTAPADPAIVCWCGYMYKDPRLPGKLPIYPNQVPCALSLLPELPDAWGGRVLPEAMDYNRFQRAYQHKCFIHPPLEQP